MKIKSIEVKNLFSYDDFKIEFNEGNIAVIVGPNNAGKTNLFRVLEFLKDVINDRRNAEDIPNYLYDKNNRKASIIVKIEFDESEKSKLENYFECFFKSEHPKFREICNKLNFNIEKKLTDLFSKGEFIWEYNGEPSGSVVPYYKISMEILKDEKLKEEFNELSKFDPIVLRSNDEELYKFCSFIFDIKDAPQDDIQKFAVVDYLHYLEDLNSIICYLSEKLDEDIYFNMDKKDKIILYNSQNEPIFKIGDLGSFSTLGGGIYDFLKEYPIKARYAIFLILMLLELDYLKNSYLSYGKISNHCKQNPSDNIIFEKAKNIFEYVDIPFDMNHSLPFHYFILKLFDKAIIKFEEVRSYPDSFIEHIIVPKNMRYKIQNAGIHDNTSRGGSIKKEYEAEYKIPTYDFDSKNYYGNGLDLAKFLFYLKNSADLELRERYENIVNKFEKIFEQEGISFDVVNYDGYPEIYIIFKDTKNQLPINRVGSGIFEVINILAVVIGNKNKIILLDEPALHLHPIYQKKLLENVIKELSKDDDNQIIIITHSPYFVNYELLSNTFRFYKINGKTKNICVGDIVKSLYGDEDKVQKKFEENEIKKRILFANGVLLTEGDWEYHSLPILLKKIEYSPENYNIEIVNVKGKGRFKEYIELLNSLKIPFGIVCDGDTAFNIYKHNRIKEEKAKKIIKKLNKILDDEEIGGEEIKDQIKKIVENYNTDYELKNENDYSTIINAFRKVFGNGKFPFWLEDNEYKGIFRKITKKMDELRKTLKNDSKDRLKTDKDIEEICIKPLYNELAKSLKGELHIFTCKEYDWTEFLGISKNNKNKLDIQKIYEFDDKEKLNDLKEFIENFINKCTNF